VVDAQSAQRAEKQQRWAGFQKEARRCRTRALLRAYFDLTREEYDDLTYEEIDAYIEVMNEETRRG
jgi:ATP-dependent protease HslVU (ClpYQ) peptidase subunit